jgi:hypothetical protein
MFHNCRHQFAVFNHRFQHLRYRMFLKQSFLFLGRGYANIDAAALGRSKLGVEALLGQVDLTRIGRVELNGGGCSRDLKGERWRIGHRYG